MRHCIECGMNIPQGRLEIFPNTFVCARHSNTQKYQGLSVYDHKTAGRIELFNPNNPDEGELIRQATRFNSRSR